MKKIIILGCAMTIALLGNAAAFKWSSTGTGSSGAIYGNSTQKLYAINNSAVVYLFDAGQVSQTSLLESLRSGSSITTLGFVDSNTINSSSKLTAHDFDYGAVGSTYDFYYAIVQDNQVFISSIVQGKGLESGSTSILFAGKAGDTKVTFDDPSAAFANGGWYSTASGGEGGGGSEGVPEPTSAILALLGLAGIALKRKIV